MESGLKKQKRPAMSWPKSSKISKSKQYMFYTI